MKMVLNLSFHKTKACLFFSCLMTKCVNEKKAEIILSFLRILISTQTKIDSKAKVCAFKTKQNLTIHTNGMCLVPMHKI